MIMMIMIMMILLMILLMVLLIIWLLTMRWFTGCQQGKEAGRQVSSNAQRRSLRTIDLLSSGLRIGPK
jgi:hypothetical protein